MLLVDGHVYGTNNSSLMCVKFEDGSTAWTARSVGKGSIAYADGHLYVRSEDGDIALVEANPKEYKRRRADSSSRTAVARRRGAHPVIAGGKLYPSARLGHAAGVRYQGEVISLDERAAHEVSGFGVEANLAYQQARLLWKTPMLPPPFRAMDPADDLGWLAVADWLEEHDDPARAELVRLTRLLRHDLDDPDRPAREARLVELLAAGVEPCVATMTNGIGMEFVYVPAGVFLMGSPPEEEGHQDDEGPVHEVEIARGFWMGKYPVTQAEYQMIVGKNPSHFSSDGEGREAVEGMDTSRFPVGDVSYEDVNSFCERLIGRDEECSRSLRYRLPTEAEWESIPGRSGPTSKRYHFGEQLLPSIKPTSTIICSGRLRSVPIRRMPSVCSICTAMSGSGAPIATTRISISRAARTIRQGNQRRRPMYYAAAAGPTGRRHVDLPPATITFCPSQSNQGSGFRLYFPAHPG